MFRSPRVLAVSLLWLVALWPLALLALGAAQPTAGVSAAQWVTRGSGWLAWGVLVAGAVAVLLYPPFVPSLRLRVRRAWMRMATSDKPVRDAYARLAQLETVNDHFAVGRFLRERGQAAAAVKHLEQAVHLDGSHTGARYQLALARRDAGDLQGAVDGLQRVLAADTQLASGQPFLDLAAILEQARLHHEADFVLRRFRSLHGDPRVALVLHARALAGLGQRDESRMLLAEAAAPPTDGRQLSLEEQNARARARVALWLGGYR
ncbi:MAG: tetratricopeptide repeat protein [Planctomycetota bacterium]